MNTFDYTLKKFTPQPYAFVKKEELSALQQMMEECKRAE
jgi:hypothetical protein